MSNGKPIYLGGQEENVVISTELYIEMRTLLKGWLDAEVEPRHAPPNLISRTKEAIK